MNLRWPPVGFVLAALLVVIHATGMRWMAAIGVAEALLAPGGTDVAWALPLTAAFLLLRLVTLLLVPGLVVASAVSAISSSRARYTR